MRISKKNQQSGASESMKQLTEQLERSSKEAIEQAMNDGLSEVTLHARSAAHEDQQRIASIAAIDELREEVAGLREEVAGRRKQLDQ